ncbi:xylulokinase [Corynebacterium glucuronolyticum]
MKAEKPDPRSITWTKRTVRELESGECSLGIELGSTNIKSTLVSTDGTPIASGSSSWENTLVDGHWSYALDDVWSGIQESFRNLVQTVSTDFGVRLTSVASLGISAMMHGYLAFDREGELLVPFRTWRDTTTGSAAEKLTQLFRVNIPLRWSISHYYQAILDHEEHVPRVDFLTTLAGYVHWKLTGQKVLGIGDAVGMFPIDSSTSTYDSEMVTAFDELVAGATQKKLLDVLPQVLVAGEEAGKLTAEGAKLLDPTGGLKAGALACPPEGDAGTGMVATNSVRPRSGNVSVGTSIFAMLVLDEPKKIMNSAIDPVATPSGDPVAMVHCNNGAQEVSTWIELFAEVAVAFGKFKITSMDEVYAAILAEALHGDKSCGGVVAYNYLSGEPIAQVNDGRPVITRASDASMSLANFIRAELFSCFSTLAIGMDTLREEGVDFDALYAHGGLFKTEGVAQRLLAAALNTPVGLAPSAATGGSWGMAILALYARRGKGTSLADFLAEEIFGDTEERVIEPVAADVEGFRVFLERFTNGLQWANGAAQAIPNVNTTNRTE